MSVVSISTEKGTHREEARSLSCLGREELEKMTGNLTGSAKTKKVELLPQKDSKQRYVNEDYIF